MDQFETEAPDGRQRIILPIEDAAPTAMHMEHRWGARQPCNARVHLTGGGGLSGIAHLRDISMSGAFLETTLSLPIFAQLEIDVVKKDGTLRVLEFPAVVVRHGSGGVGIEWCDSNPGSICCKFGCGSRCAYQEGNRQ